MSEEKVSLTLSHKKELFKLKSYIDKAKTDNGTFKDDMKILINGASNFEDLLVRLSDGFVKFKIKNEATGCLDCKEIFFDILYNKFLELLRTSNDLNSESGDIKNLTSILEFLK